MTTNENLTIKDLSYFITLVKNHKLIREVECGIGGSSQILKLSREFGDEITVYLTIPYTLGITDYQNIRCSFPDVNCIVICSDYSGFTNETKNEAEKEGIGLFMFREFVGAISRKDFWSYSEEDNY